MSRHPEVKWAEREDKVFITVQLPNAADAKVVLEPEGVFGFTASGGADKQPYEIKLNLHDKVNVEESKINVGPRNVFCIIEKAEKQWWKKLVKDVKTPHYVKVDWDKWVDEDDDEPAGGAGDLDMGGMDFSKFSDMGGMGGLGGMGGMGGLEGLGGMGGMSGMGGMGDFDDTEDEGEELSSHEEKDEGKAEATEKPKEAEA
uniref:Co-chaperone protein p23 n=1 Tax=Kalanchoe fedtschenkoi TaxID=63787 RepID=A0A7N0VCA9_KALFE